VRLERGHLKNIGKQKTISLFFRCAEKGKVKGLEGSRPKEEPQTGLLQKKTGKCLGGGGEKWGKTGCN